MAKREIPEINAGSMADIAFLLLIFFLVTTTMDQEIGIKRQLPQETESETEQIVKKNNVLEILTTSSDYTLVGNVLDAEVLIRQGKKFEGIVKIRELKEYAKEFLLNETSSKELPDYFVRKEEEAKLRMEAIDQQIAGLKSNDPLINKLEEKKEDWEDRMMVIQSIGEDFREISKFAIMAVKLDPKTNYDVYIQIQAQLEAAQNELRDEFAQKYFSVSYFELDKDIDADYEKLKVLKELVPQRILIGENK